MICTTPFHLETKAGSYNPITGEHEKYIPVNCNKCPACIDRRIKQWAFRLHEEWKQSKSAYFVTLTYNEENLPLHRPNGHFIPIPILKKRDLELFFKRLRGHDKRRKTPTMHEAQQLQRMGVKRITRDSRLKRPPIKYLAVGELGSKTLRPHYHAVIFNTFPKHIEDSWKLGRIDIKPYHPNSAMYTMKYLQSETPPEHKQWENEEWYVKPYQVQSKNLGMCYLVNEDGEPTNMYQWHQNAPLCRNFVTLPYGQKTAIPEPFKEILWDDATRTQIRHDIHYTLREKEADERAEIQRQGKDWAEWQVSKHKAALNVFKKANYKRNKI